MTPTDSNHPAVQLIFSGDEYYAKILYMIEHAKSEILLESYIFNFDPIGIQILTALQLAQSRGAQVRLLVDGIGSYNSVNAIYDFCTKHRIPFRIYHPLPFELRLMPKISWKNLKRFLRTFQRVNKRNHRKTIIIDREHVFIGSFNISQIHSAHFMDKKAWRDTGALVSMTRNYFEVENLALAFFQAWRSAKYFSTSNIKSYLFNRRTRPRIQTKLFRLNNYTYWRLLLFRDLKQKIKHAKNQILITNAYFLPRRSFVAYLKKAAERGVQVKILLPVKSDIWIFKQASHFLYYRLLRAGIQIYEYQPRMMHAKTLIIDDWATLGSHNFNHRSLIHDLEADLVIQDPHNLIKLTKQWDQDLQSTKKVTMQDLGQFSLFQRLISRLIYWFRYWL